MPGLFDTSTETSTTLPGWFTDKQAGIANTATNVYNATPAPGDTALKGLGDTFNSAQNPFTTAMGGLQDVYQGIKTAFNPDGTPNNQSPLGSLFASQYNKLDNILPQVTAKEGAAGIGGGGFNSLRGQTATNTARAGALTTLAEQQNQALLNAQTQGIQALQGIGNVGSQYGTTGINVANAQMLGGLPAVAKYSDIVNNMGTVMPKTTTEISKLSYADQLAKGVQLALGAGKTIQAITAGTTGIPWLDKMLKPSGANATDDGTTGGINDVINNLPTNNTVDNTTDDIQTQADLNNSDLYGI